MQGKQIHGVTKKISQTVYLLFQVAHVKEPEKFIKEKLKDLSGTVTIESHSSCNEAADAKTKIRSRNEYNTI